MGKVQKVPSVKRDSDRDAGGQERMLLSLFLGLHVSLSYTPHTHAHAHTLWKLKGHSGVNKA